MVATEQLRQWVNKALLAEDNARKDQPGKPAIHLTDLESRVLKHLQDTGEMPSGPNQFHAQLTDAYKDQIQEMIWGFVIQGIVLPGTGTQSPNLPHMKVTPWGRKCLEEGEYVPHDAGQYIARLRTEISTIDPAIPLYLKDSLAAFRAGAYLASAVMVGVGSEKALLLLCEAVSRALPDDTVRKAFAARINDRGIKTVFDEIWKRLDPVHIQLANDLHKEDVKAELEGVFELIRKTRNEAGHPSGREISKDEAYILLLLFPIYCKTIYATIEWLASHPF